MKKLLYFIPSIVAILFYSALVMLGGFGAINPIVWIFILLLLVSAILMAGNLWWGIFPGLFVGIALIYMSTQYTGQPVDIERPIGIIYCAYHVICGWIIARNRERKKTKEVQRI